MHYTGKDSRITYKQRQVNLKPKIQCGLRVKQGGFTMVEVMIVALIMGITASVSLPVLHSAIEGSKLSGAADEVVTALEFARLNAMISGMPMRVTVNKVAETVLVEQLTFPESILDSSKDEINENTVEAGVFNPMQHPLRPGVDYLISISDKSWLGAADINTATFGPGNKVVFDPTGTPSYGGKIALAFASRQVVITLDALTGSITVSD